MTNMAAMPIYCKNLKKSSSTKPIDQWPWNLICSLVYESTTKVLQIMALGWPWPILRQGQIWSHRLLYGKKWKIIYFFGNCSSLGSQSCLKHLAKWVNEVEWVLKVKVILWPWSKVTQISKLKLVFRKSSWAIWNQSSYESFRENRNENLYKWVGSMTNMAAMPIYVKNLKKSSIPEPIDQWPWNLVCSIVYGSTTKVVQIMTLGWPWPILRQGQIWSHRLLYGIKWKSFFFGNYCSLRSQSCLKHSTKWVNEVEWVSKVKVILWTWSKVI